MIDLFLSWHPSHQVAFIVGCLFVIGWTVCDLWETANYWRAVSRINTDEFFGKDEDVPDNAAIDAERH